MRGVYLALLVLLAACASASAPTALPPPTQTPAPAAALPVFVAVQAPASTAELRLFAADGAPLTDIAGLVSGAPCLLGADTLIYTLLDPTSGASGLAWWRAGVSEVLTTTLDAAFSDPICGATLDATVFLRSPYALIDDEPAPPELWHWQGQAAQPLVQGIAGPALNALYSPDNSWLAYELIDPPALAAEQVSSGAGVVLPYVGTFDWLPASSALVIGRRAAGPDSRFPELVQYDVRLNKETVLLTDLGADLYYPRAASTGALAYVRRPLGAEQGEIWYWPEPPYTTAEPVQLTADGRYDNFDMRWSPDGARLLWSRVELATQTYSIWQMQLPGGQPELLLTDAWWGRWLPPAE